MRFSSARDARGERLHGASICVELGVRTRSGVMLVDSAVSSAASPLTTTGSRAPTTARYAASSLAVVSYSAAVDRRRPRASPAAAGAGRWRRAPARSRSSRTGRRASPTARAGACAAPSTTVSIVFRSGFQRSGGAMTMPRAIDGRLVRDLGQRGDDAFGAQRAPGRARSGGPRRTVRSRPRATRRPWCRARTPRAGVNGCVDRDERLLAHRDAVDQHVAGAVRRPRRSSGGIDERRLRGADGFVAERGAQRTPCPWRTRSGR